MDSTQIFIHEEVERILKKAGFVKKKRRQKQYTTERISNRVIPQNPNDVWTVDFKGWWYTPKKEKCEPLTIRDEFSKYIFSIKILDKSTTYCVKQEFERIFKDFGLPKVIKSDNGPPFASSKSMHGLTKLAVWWMSLGIMLDRIDPGAPYQNGSHERMHRDIKDELEMERGIHIVLENNFHTHMENKIHIPMENNFHSIKWLLPPLLVLIYTNRLQG